MDKISNTFNKIKQPLVEAFNGPRTVDFEFDKKVEEYKLVRNRVMLIKEVLDTYADRLTGWKEILNKISTFDLAFDKDQKAYSNFMHNVVQAHKALLQKIVCMQSELTKLSNISNKFIDQFNEIDGKLEVRKEKRKDYDHYDEKMEELTKDRNKTLSKGKTPSESDEERYTRNIEKFQKAAGEYVNITNETYKNINQFLDARYDNIATLVASLCELEKTFFTEGMKIAGFFNNFGAVAKNLKSTLVPLTSNNNNGYDATNYIRGGELLSKSASAQPLPTNTVSTAPHQPQGHFNQSGFSQGNIMSNQSVNNKPVVNPFAGAPPNNPFNGTYSYNPQQNNNMAQSNYNKAPSFDLKSNPYDDLSADNPYNSNNLKGNPYENNNLDNNANLNPYGNNDGKEN